MRTVFLIVAMLAVTGGAQGEDLFFTDFSNFSIGPDNLVGTDDWDGTNIGERVHGIDNDAVPLAGKSAYIGRDVPSSNSILVFQPISHNPATSQEPVVEFSSFIGLENSTNNKGDIFYLSFFNSADKLLASLAFDNRINAGRPIWRYDGAAFNATGDTFLHGELQPLRIFIDYTRNTWSAHLDSIFIFIDQPFTATAETKDLGSIAVEWTITEPGMPGDNWFLFDQWDVRATVPPEPFAVATVTMSSGIVNLGWTGEVGYEYQVEYSDNALDNWKRDLPNSLLEGAGSLTFMDTNPPEGIRFYRVCRRVKP